MTRTGPTRRVDATYASGRLANARAYLEAAREAVALVAPGANANPAMSQIGNAAIAYADALTSRRAGRVNQHDHRAATWLLRDAFGKELPTAQERRLRRILDEEEEVQYGPTRGRSATPEILLGELEEFAALTGRRRGRRGGSGLVRSGPSGRRG